MRRIAGIATALLLIAGLVVTVGPDAAAATTHFVDVEDVACSDITGTPFCSIQAAVDAATGGDTIQVAAGTYTGSATNVVQIFKDLTIIGANRDTVIIEGEFARRGVSVSGGATVTIRDLTIQNGDIVGSGAGVQVVDPGTSLSMLFVRITGNSASGWGGGLYAGNNTSFSIFSGTIDDNHATNSQTGGGLYLDGAVSGIVNYSTLQGNTATANGGAIAVNGGATFNISNSTVTGNSATDRGGGIWATSVVNVSAYRVDFTGNHATGGTGDGGAIAFAGTGGVFNITASQITANDADALGGGIWTNATGNLNVDVSTVSGNMAGGFGGGIYTVDGGGTISDSTIYDNQSTTSVGGGLYSFNNPRTVRNTIIAGNSDLGTTSPDCNQIASAGYNLIQDPTGCVITGDTTGNITGQDPLLGALADNGGPTLTHAIPVSSPARDAANPAAPESDVDACGKSDQRGYNRVDRACDIGAYELLLAVVRFAGANRFGTAAAISAGDFPESSLVTTVFVAVGDNFPDALAGAAIAGKLGAPLLLVNTDSIPAETAAELTRLNPLKIVILGGSAVVSPAVEAALGGYATSVERLAGNNRYETAVEISKYGFPANGSADTVVIATGLGFADALTGGPAAVMLNGPVLLTDPNSLPAVVSAEITRLAPNRIVVVGGTAAVSNIVFDELKAMVGNTARIFGANRYETAIAVSKYAFPAGAWRAYVATGLNFPDALAGAAAAGWFSSPVLLVPGTSLPAEVSTEIGRLVSDIIIILGGTAVVTPAVETSLEGLLGL